MSEAPLLEVDRLSIRFDNGRDRIHAVTDVSFELKRGEILSLVGESGCGKSVTALSVMGLLPRRSVSYGARSAIRFQGRDILGLGERQMNAVRGQSIAMVFQDPMTSLNPTLTVGRQIAESVVRHRGVSWSDAEARAREMLDLVHIPDAASRLHAYPHELSGGMRQRVMIAIGLSCDPDLLIADEPTTALDVTVQAQILDLIGELTSDLSMSCILITHDLGVVAETAHRLAVMYAGQIVETGKTSEVFANPSHAYTLGLLQALPAVHFADQSELAEIPGSVPRLDHEPTACGYAPRCAFAVDACSAAVPGLEPIGGEHLAACLQSRAVNERAGDSDIVEAWR